jgi:hypothetical protein
MSILSDASALMVKFSEMLGWLNGVDEKQLQLLLRLAPSAKKIKDSITDNDKKVLERFANAKIHQSAFSRREQPTPEQLIDGAIFQVAMDVGLESLPEYPVLIDKLTSKIQELDANLFVKKGSLSL